MATLPITTIRQAVEKQVRNRASEAGHAFQRICRTGYSEDDAIRRIMLTLATEYYRLLFLGQSPDKARYENDLRRLPTLPWEGAGKTDITEALVIAKILENPDLNLMTEEDTVTRYRQLRAKSSVIFHDMLKRVATDGITESAKTLGIMRNNVLVGNESEMAIVMDHALFANKRQRIRYIDEYLSGIPEPDDDTLIIADALREIRFCLLHIKAVIPNSGAQVCDLLRGHHFPLIDISLSQTAIPDAVLATHVFKPDGIHISTGAILPLVDPDAAREVGRIYDWASSGGKDEFDNKNETGELTTGIMRILLKHGAGSRVEYATPGEAVHKPAQNTARVGPNAPCPCGSGKKYKKCCGSY